MSNQKPAGGELTIPNWQGVAKIIDHTNLRPEATPNRIIALCDEAKQFEFGAVMVNSCYIELAASRLRDTDVKVGAVVGFPLGAALTSVKLFETSEALKLGAHDIDTVVNIGALKAGDVAFVLSEVEALCELVHKRGALLKVIIETVLLTDEEKHAACEISEKAGADFVKTSTGFLGGVATIEDVVLMHRTVKIGIKASGGIRTASDAMAMIQAGATRLGTSSGVSIIRELRGEVPHTSK